ncbi:MAG: GIY-YIG nuclease family protein [Candidatus Edwardsbacteria bacterium]
MRYTLYLLHFNNPVERNGVKFQHYLGYTSLPLEERLERHRKGQGSLWVRWLLANGAKDFIVAFTQFFSTQQEARQREISLKKRMGKHLCPLCKINEKLDKEAKDNG